jgi:hypothetical protein
MTTDNHQPSGAAGAWVRIPDGTKVRHRHSNLEGFIDGLTEIVSGPNRNPDRRTQYRINVGTDTRTLLAEDELALFLDKEGLVIMAREKAPFRQVVTDRLRGAFPDDRFIKTA